jgi:hypothetical protein
MNTIDNISTAQSVTLITDNPFTDVTKAIVIVDNTVITTATTTTIYYELVADSVGRAVINIKNVTNSATCYTVTATIYGDPAVEFWKYDFDAAGLDTSLSGGNWDNSGNFVGALGYSPEDLIVDGDQFMSPNVSYAPEEFVPGHTVDSLGVNVYTKDSQSYGTIITGSFPVIAGTTTSAYLSILPQADAGIMVYFNNTIFQRSTSLGSLTTGSNQFFIEGDQIILPPQAVSGRAGYTVVRTGGSGLIDSNMVSIANTTTGIVDSLTLSYADVRAVYVLNNGREVSQVTTTTDYGYMIKPDFTDNKRASVWLYNLPYDSNTVEAWFFDTPYIKFNRMSEEYFSATTPTSTFVLTYPPGDWEPFSDKAIVETGVGSTSTIRTRKYPPPVSNYTIVSNQTVFAIDNKVSHPPYYYTAAQIMVYANGVRIQSGFDFTFDLPNNNIILTTGQFPNGTYISITRLEDYEYIISGNILQFVTPVSDTTIKVTTFNNHDAMFMQTEKFAYTPIKRFTLQRPVINDNYVWVYFNGVPLIHRYDFEILEDQRTIQLDEWFVVENLNSTLLVTSIMMPEYTGRILGFRIFNDFFDRFHYKRLSAYHTTFLIEPLKYTDDKIVVHDGDSRLSPFNAQRNIPGVVLIDRERIEYNEKDGDILTYLRRGTLGTGPAFYVDEGSKVIDQGIQQTIPYSDSVYIQRFTSTNTTTYIITATTTSTIGDGIILTNGIDAIDQVLVYYGGRQLRKRSMKMYESVTSTNLITMPSEFTITTSSQALTLNINGGIEPGVLISIIQKKGYVWTGTESLLISNVLQAQFLRAEGAELPDTYYYGGDPRLLDSNNIPLTDDDGVSLTRY